MNDLSQQPGTIADVSRRVLAGQQAFDPAVREFLDEFYSHPSRRQASLREEPALIEDVKDAYLARPPSIWRRATGSKRRSGWKRMVAPSSAPSSPAALSR